ncbi:MAG TPA: membrane protein insertase YidC, partial [Amaricoccus sp.]|nr:membrane protein insertase YidC [Amaricoccus sp.]
MDNQSKNLILATALSFAVILVWFLLFPPQDRPAPVPTATDTAQPATPGASGTSAPTLAAPEAKPRAEALAQTERVAIDTPRLGGSFSLTGGRIDDIRLLSYHETIDDGSPTVTLFNPAGAAQAYYALYGWSAAAGTATPVPGPNTQWTIESGDKLTPATPVTLRWDNGAGVVFRQTLAVDENYMFTVTQSVENATGAEVSVAPYGIVARHGQPAGVKGFWILHEGAVGVA